MGTTPHISDRVVWALLGAAGVAAAALILYLNRGTTFFLDELVHVYNSPYLDLKYVFEPVNGHLGITSKLVYKVVLEAVGADYVVFRVLHVLAELVAAGVFYALIKRRVGALVALAPTVVLLFLGSAFSHVVIPVGFGIFVCIAAALGALLCLERGDRRGDIWACVLLVVSIMTFTIGLAFLVGAGISVLLRQDRWRRAWIFLIPAALYVAWWIWSQSQPGSSGEETALSSVFEIPRWTFDSLSAVTNSIAGFQYDFAGGSVFGALGWGRVLAVIALAGLAYRLWLGHIPSTLWVALGIVLSYWALGAMAEQSGLRAPASMRYMYPGAVMVFLVAAEAARDVRWSPVGVAALFMITAVSVVGNVVKLRDGGADFRNYSNAAKAQFAALDLARGNVPPEFNTEVAAPEASPVGARADIYFESADDYGSLGYTLPELEAQGEGTRHVADQILTPALGLRLAPARGASGGECETAKRAGPGQPVTFGLPPGGAVMRADARAPAPITVGRFDEAPSVALGHLPPGEPVELRIPRDSSQVPWHAEVAEVRSVRVCGPA